MKSACTLCTILYVVYHTSAFQCRHRQIVPLYRLLAKSEDETSDEQDWRAFRAKLVMGETKERRDQKGFVDEEDIDGIGSVFESVTVDETAFTPLDPSQWAYDSGNVIEQGAVILGGVDQDFGFGLRQQYFHKAAILVLEHKDATFTKGIILNRPTGHTLQDDDGVQWRVWFGGDVQGLVSDVPDIICLHSLKSQKVRDDSETVMNDIQITSFESAKKLVQRGHAVPSDFWVFAGYAGWGPGQLMGELDRKSWYMVATDSQTLLKELARQSESADPRDAGLDTWTLLMTMIGNKEKAEEYSGGFDDHMLKEWAYSNLMSKEDSRENNSVNFQLKAFTSPAKEVRAGSILRASSGHRSPFLLRDQEMHKSLVLIIDENDDRTIGVILNRPSSKCVEIQVKQGETGESMKLPLRYGGQYAIATNDVLLWLHHSKALRDAQYGEPVGSHTGFWQCRQEEVSLAIQRGKADPSDFIAVVGVTVWPKHEKLDFGGGGAGQVLANRYEIVTENKYEKVWTALRNQHVLTSTNVMSSLRSANDAWKAAGIELEGTTQIGGLRQGEDDDTVVFKTDVKVSELSDDALQSWLATFLLGSPMLGAT